MSIFQSINFKNLCLNGQIVTLIGGGLNQCDVYQQQGRYHWDLSITNEVRLELDVERSLVEFKYSKWVKDSDVSPILDFRITLISIPSWMAIYSSAETGCVHNILATLRVDDSQSNYNDFTRNLCSILPKMQWDETLAATTRLSSSGMRDLLLLTRVYFKQPHFSNFSCDDLMRLKNDDEWLSDTHVTLGLLDCFQDCVERNIWGKRKIKLLDTTFWETLIKDSGRYKGKFRKNNDILDCDFAVMPMFENHHWRLGIVENPAEFVKGNTIFHILDSLRDITAPKKETKLVQKILLNHFEDESFKEGRISTNIAQVPLQRNSIDCACFVIYFGKKFFLSPDSTLALLKKNISTPEEGLAVWGLKNSNMTFLRREMRALLYKYINKGDAIVEFD